MPGENNSTKIDNPILGLLHFRRLRKPGKWRSRRRWRRRKPGTRWPVKPVRPPGQRRRCSFGGGRVNVQRHYKKKDTSVTFRAERKKFCHTYDTSMTKIVTKPCIIIDVVGVAPRLRETGMPRILAQRSRQSLLEYDTA